MRFRLLLLAVAFLADRRVDQHASVPDGELAITGATLIDGSGTAPRPNAVVIVERGRVSCVGTVAECAVPARARRIDARRRWLIPGLFDAHVHMSEEHGHFGPLYLAFGITSVRDMGGYPDSRLRRLGS